MSVTGKLRISILHPEASISPLQFRHWFRAEAASIQSGAAEHDIIIIRLFLPVRVLSSITQRRIDVLLSETVNTHPNIHRVELRTVVTSLAAAEMMSAAEEAQHDLEEMIKQLPPPDNTLH